MGRPVATAREAYSDDGPLMPISTVRHEENLISCVLYHNEVLDDPDVWVKPGMFQDEALGRIWGAILELHEANEPISAASLGGPYHRFVQAIGIERWADISTSYVPASDAQKLAKWIREGFNRRVLQDVANRILLAARDPEKRDDELIEMLSDSLLYLETESDAERVSVGDKALTAYYEWLLKIDEGGVEHGILTGWTSLDILTLGWKRKDLIVVGGRTSVGKSAFSIEVALRAARQGYKVLIFSLEMSEEQVRMRMAANLARVPLHLIVTGKVKKDDLDRMNNLGPFIAKIGVCDKRGMTAEEIAAEMRRYKRKYGLDLVIVDYIQEIDEKPLKQDTAGAALARVTRKLRKAAQVCDCAVMTLSQLRREAEGKAPTLADLFGSSGIETGADMIILLHRERDEENKNALQVHVAKHRNGPTGKIEMHYDPERQTIHEFETRREYE
ncbi:replicative DNA helicase [Alicyclobacillus vulcanalis]|uniref:DNA 5'-3' helicase n=1 Tax=Alicyclobacillus vulcanalis TaxID=252246 RepID=A0A1N7MS03_9BACL|nr:DnaB-like helicase C-terminal domain-containing protein [Alicyclobacillus vulcanalis]SIS88850.1 replicative DNA helicase [Alicyclobacillus vulcanalis]